ncbi:MAG TPA: glycosyltransferase, partial [Candidatus Polarisedimenticolaceae bacterium]|nr:glycosyltransferase [Candidatus Polarisedimenticolaceae bacterium]
MFEILFWVAVLLLFHVYVGYPWVMCAWAAVRPAPTLRRRIEPDVSVLVVAHNEERVIAARLRNLLALDYPRARLEILLASDGSTDATVERARHVADRAVRVFAFPQRRGKAAVLG